MPQSHALRHVPRAGPPHQRVLERLLQRAVYLVAHVLDARAGAHDQRLGEVGRGGFPCDGQSAGKHRAGATDGPKPSPAAKDAAEDDGSFEGKLGGSREFGSRELGGVAHSPLRVDAHQPQLLPAAVHDVLDAEVELAAHDGRVRLARELVEEVEADGVDLVVYVET